MKFERKVYLAFLMAIAGMLPVAVVTFLSIQAVLNDEDSLFSIHSRAALLTERLRYMNSVQSSMLPVFVLSGDDRIIENFEKRQIEFEKIANELADLATNPAAVQKINEIKRLSEAQHDAVKPGIQMRKNGFSVAEVHDYFARNGATLSQRLKLLMRQLAEDETRALEQSKAKTAREIQHAVRALIFLLLFAAAALVIIGRLLVKLMSQKRAYDQTQAELVDRAQRLSQARKETVEVVSHDLKNPLGSIKMSLEILHDSPLIAELPRDLQEVLRIVDRATQSMDTLITNLLDHSKIESGNLALNNDFCDFSSLLEHQVQCLAPHAAKKQISLDLQVPKEIVMVGCDSLRIEQVVSNLIGNAIKFSPQEGRIGIRFEAVQGRAQVTIEDRGPGVKEAEIPRLFDRFWQARGTAHQGTGLGLAITKAIVDAHKGFISVQNRPGGGTMFIFSIPIRRQNSTGILPHGTLSIEERVRSPGPDVTA